MIIFFHKGTYINNHVNKISFKFQFDNIVVTGYSGYYFLAIISASIMIALARSLLSILLTKGVYFKMASPNLQSLSLFNIAPGL